MWTKILLLFFVFSFLFKTDHSFDQDLGRHLKLGEIIVKTGRVPSINLFSYTNPNFPFINTHWLFEVWVYLTSQVIGLQALLIIKIAVFLFSVWLILKTIPKNSNVLLLPVAFIFLHTLRERTELRPEIFSFLFTAFTLFALERFLATIQKPYDRDTFVLNTGLIALLPVVQLIWINTHIYFFVGLILQAIFLLHSAIVNLRFHPKGGHTKLLLIIFLLSGTVSLINPNGLTGLIYPLNVTKNYGYTIVENQTMFLLESINFKDPNFLFVKFSLGIILFFAVTAFLKRKFELKNILVCLFGVILALMNVRSFPYLVFLSLPAAMSLGVLSGPTPRWIKMFTLTAGFLLLLESYLYLNGDYYRSTDSNNTINLKFAESGKKALDFVINNDLPNPIYNNFDIGSYIIYRGYPKYKVFVDGRPEGYPKEFFQEIYIPTQSDYTKFKSLEETWGFKTIIFSHTDQTPWGRNFLASVVKDHDWKIVYLDDFMIILVKNDYLASQVFDLFESLRAPQSLERPEGSDRRGIPSSSLSSESSSLRVEDWEAIDLGKVTPDVYRFDSHVSYLRLALFLLQTGDGQTAQKFAEKGLALYRQSPLGNALFGVGVQNKFFW